jgi:hypothetical protein
MFADRIKINLSTLKSGATETYIKLPLSMRYQLVDTGELIQREFVDIQTEKAINKPLDYDRVRFTPIDINLNVIKNVVYNTYHLLPNGTYTNNYGDIGFDYDDVKFRKNSFFKSFLRLSLYDSDDVMSQNFVGFMTLFCKLRKIDLEATSSLTNVLGMPKPINQIFTTFVVENPILNKESNAEGYYLYYYKDSLNIGETKTLYMKASFNNAKTGFDKNMMRNNTIPPSLTQLAQEQHIKIFITRTTTGYYYRFDETQSNISLSSNQIVVNLYEIKSL